MNVQEGPNISGFRTIELCNDILGVVVVPSLGGRVVSLLDQRTGREWMWHPGPELRLFTNDPNDDFAKSPLAGWDECVPTVNPCVWRGRTLPDHGELWPLAWREDGDALEVDFPVSPLRLRRKLTLDGETLTAGYALTNLGTEPEPILWAMHPLFTIHPGDRIELAPGARAELGDPAWLDTLDVSDRTPACVKTFVSATHGAVASIVSSTTGTLTLSWDAAWATHLGIWLSRGGWNGYHQLALEPTTAPCNAPTESNALPVLQPGETSRWSVRVGLDLGRAAGSP